MSKFLIQFTEQISQPFSIFFFMAYGLSLFMFHVKKRRKLLFIKFVSDLNYIVYYFLIGGISGALGASIAGVGGLVQILTPDHMMQKTKKYRIAAAIFLACIGLHFTMQKTSDMLPLLAVIMARLAEISSSAQRIRIGMLITFTPWMVYNLSHEFYLLLFANITVFISLAHAIWHHHRLRIIPEPV